MSLATVTPSWVTVGAPHFLSSATLRPLGPRVVLTALARTSTPDFRDCRAWVSNSMSLDMKNSLSRWQVILGGDNREDVFFRQDEEILVLVLELGAGVLREEDLVANL